MKKIFIAVALIFIIIFGIRLYQEIKKAPPLNISTLQEKSGIPVDVITVEPQNFSEEILVTGTIGSEEEANISTKIPGRVVAVYADAGMYVKANQVLAVIDETQLKIQKAQIQNQILIARTNLETIKIQIDDARRDVNRMEELYKEGAISKKQLEGYQLKLDTLNKNFEAAQKNLKVVEDNLQLINTQIDDCTIKAPFDGIIGNKWVEIGEIVNPGQILMTIYNTGKLNAQMKVPEVYIPQIKKGQSAEIKLDAIGDRNLTGKITKISGSPDPKTRMFTVYVSIPGLPNNVKPGMFATGRITTKTQKNIFLIPGEALIQEGDENFVYIVDNNIAKKVKVVTGQQINGNIEIVSGLSKGDKVVTTGKENLSPESIVKIISEISQK